MNQRNNAEIFSLLSFGFGILASIVVIALYGKGDPVTVILGALASAIPMLINAIRNVSSSKAMQTMADALGNSAPVANSTSNSDDGSLLLDTPAPSPRQT